MSKNTNELQAAEHLLAKVKQVGDKLLAEQKARNDEQLQTLQDNINKDTIKRLLASVKGSCESHVEMMKELEKQGGSIAYEMLRKRLLGNLSRDIRFDLKLYKVGVEIKHTFLEQLLALTENKNGLDDEALANAIMETCKNYFSQGGPTGPAIPVGKGSR